MENETADSTNTGLRLHDPRVVDAHKAIIDTSGYPAEDMAQIVAVMDAMYRWRIAEARLSEASRKYMQLGENDMKALRFIMVMTDRGDHATAKSIADHLGISTAATTKLLDRLERANHVHRTPHPHDRRALAIVIDDKTRAAAQETVGREYARRFRIAANLDAQQRQVVTDFLTTMSQTTEADWERPTSPAPGHASGR